MKMYFKLLPKAGSHAEKGPSKKAVIYKASEGNVIETENDLVKMFPGKFERVEVTGSPVRPIVEAKVKAPAPAPATTQPSVPASSKKAKDAKETKAVEEVSVESKLGRDVTKRFPHALEEDFKVFSTGGEFFVTEADEIDKALNDKPLKKGQVEAFVDKYLKG